MLPSDGNTASIGRKEGFRWMETSLLPNRNKGPSSRTALGLIQKHYVNLANKIFTLLCTLAMAAVVVTPLLTLAEALALGTDVVAEHGAENEVFFGSELVERTVDNHADGIQALLLSEEKVQTVVAHGLYDVADA